MDGYYMALFPTYHVYSREIMFKKIKQEERQRAND